MGELRSATIRHRARILLVDGDDRLAGALTAFLLRRDYDVVHVRTARAAVDHHADRPHDVVLLELALPDGDGLETCRKLRSAGDAGIIIVTARSEPGQRVTGLRAGADDYVVKPYAIPELHARIDAVLRRSRRLPRQLRVGPIRIDLDARCARVDEAPVPLTHKEFHLLVLLAREAGTVVTRLRLAAEVWPGIRLGRSRTLDVHISNLRSKLGAGAALRTVHGFGYRLDPPQQAGLQ